jgi:hypothetical protein
MRFNFLRPLNGWRVFFGEVGIIVLGVLIALGAGQLADAWQWQQQVKQAKELFKQEMDSATANAYMQLAIESCLTNRLEEIEKELSQPAGDWKSMAQELNWRGAQVPVPRTPKPYYGSSGYSLITTEGWNNALASGTINHMSYKQGIMLARAYASAKQLSDHQSEERAAAARLLPLATDRFLSADSRVSMIQTISDIRRIVGEIHSDSIQVLLNAKQTELGYNDATLHHGDEGLNEYLLDLERTYRGSCVKKPHLPQ